MLADGGTYTREETLQHRFFAATGIYDGPRGRMLVKFGRRSSLVGLPLGWLGRFLTRREVEMYDRCAGIVGIPDRYERIGRDGFARPLVAGHPLQRGERVDDEFFPDLQRLVRELHERRIAFVDLQKCENVLVDDGGRPWLFDFQTAWRWPERSERRGLQRVVPQWLGESLLRRLQRADRFHVLKHWRRSRPDTISDEEFASTRRPGRLIRLHRVFLDRWRALRRKLGLRRD